MRHITELAYLGAGVTDLPAWKAYAVEVLGLEITADSTDELTYLRVDDRHHRLLLEPAEVDDVAYLGWQVRDGDGLAAAVDAVRARDVEVTSATADELASRLLLDMAWFTCPYSGIRMELAYGHEAQFSPRFCATRPLAGFSTGAQGLGHVVVYAAEVRAATEFYRDVLGFGISDYAVIPGMGPLVSFLHCNPRHHSLSFFGVPNAPRKIQHLMLETLDLDDVGTTYDLCLERGITTTSLGRHPNDRSFSFYFRNPGGWHMEFAWGSRLIDPDTWVTEHYVAGRPNAYWGHQGLMEML